MNNVIFRKVRILTVFCVALITIAFSLPMTCYGEVIIEVSPNQINIEGNRFGDIRIFTSLRYTNYDFNTDEVYVYINPIEGEVGVSVENIRPGRDSWGNLIIRFNLEDLLAVPNLRLNINDYNTFQLVIIKDSYEYSYQDEFVYIIDKKSP